MVSEPSPAPEPGAPRASALPDLIDAGGPERGTVTRIALVIAALACFALGILFWLIPVLTGVPFLLLAFLCLGMASHRVARWINIQERRLPKRCRLWLRPRLRRTTIHPPVDDDGAAPPAPPGPQA